MRAGEPATRANRIILATNFVGGRQYVVLSGPDGVVNAEWHCYYQLGTIS